MAREARGDAFDSEDEGFDFRRLAVTLLWVAGAAVTVVGVVLSAQTETGSRRLALALEGFPLGEHIASNPPAARQVRTTAGDAEARRVSEIIAGLLADRDRLVARVDALERTSDVTGSIPPQPAAALPATNLATAGISSVPASPQQVVRLEPSVSQDIAASDSVATKTEFGIDLGRDVTLDGLRGIWASLKTQHAGLLDGLRPIVAVRDGGKPGQVALHLVAGPLANAALAARLCATLTGVGIACQPATFDGQRLAIR